MKRGLLALGVVLTAAGALSSPRESSKPLVVHEWGTFTSIAGKDGNAVEWLPLNGPSDLPGFVERYRFNLKTSVPALVRMETPVLYFYAKRELTVDVGVQFHSGAITEWFPKASELTGPSTADLQNGRGLARSFTSAISWNQVRLTPNASDAFQTEGAGSHYYIARQTDASPLETRSQREKFLFYRGIANFQPPLSAMLTGEGHVLVRNRDGAPLGSLVLFENRGGTIAFRVYDEAGAELSADIPKLDGESAAPGVDLERILVAHGLYAREAKAMVDTWRDTWFGEGTRIFYVVPSKTIDAILPLTIAPAPSEVVRVFVGRIELRSPAASRPAQTP
jgi:hypothetical protein